MNFPSTFIYRLHAVQRMFQRNISEQGVEAVIRNGSIIQEYNDDKPYPSYLVAGEYENMNIHVVISINHEDNQTIIITAYVPTLDEWESGFKIRRRK